MGRNPLPTGSRIMALRYTEELYPPETVAQLLGELRDRGCAPPRPSPTYLLLRLLCCLLPTPDP